MEEVYEKAEPPYSGLTDDEEACACTRSRWCGGRAFADEHRLAGVPTGRAATLVFSLVCIASAIDCVASLCTTGMRLVAGAALAVCAAYNLWATWTPTPLPFPPTWAWHKRASRAHGVESGCAGAAAMVLFHTLLIAIAGAIVAATLAYNFVPWSDLVQWNCESAKQAAWDWLRGS